MFTRDHMGPAALTAVFALSFLAAATVTRLSMAAAHRYALHAIPNQRSSHTDPTPQLGGLGASFAPLLFLFYLAAFPPRSGAAGPPVSYHAALALGALVFFAVGLWDDVRALSPKTKLLGQFAGAAVSFHALSLIHTAATSLRDPAALVKQGGIVALWVCWIVGFVNAYNFMDGMNGKAGVFAVNVLVFTLLILGLVAHAPGNADNPADGSASIGLLETRSYLGSQVYVPLAVIAIASVCGFLVFNCRPRALVFLGDCGSHFLGFLIAALAFLASESLWGRGRSLLAFVILLMPFLYDVTYTMTKRALARKKIWMAHREHLYQRLLICGMSHMRVLGICAATYVACGVLSVVCALSEAIVGRLVCVALSLAVMGAYTLFVFRKEAGQSPAL